jgi:hypothetical protein
MDDIDWTEGWTEEEIAHGRQWAEEHGTTPEYEAKLARQAGQNFEAIRAEGIDLIAGTFRWWVVVRLHLTTPRVWRWQRRVQAAYRALLDAMEKAIEEYREEDKQNV